MIFHCMIVKHISRFRAKIAVYASEFPFVLFFASIFLFMAISIEFSWKFSLTIAAQPFLFHFLLP